MNITEILQNIGFFSIAIGLITWLAKSIIKNLINKNFEDYKNKLLVETKSFQSKIDFEFEKHKAQLNLFNLKNSKFTEKQSLLIEEIYSILVDLEPLMIELTKDGTIKITQDGKTYPDAYVDEIIDLYNELVKSFEKKKFYLPKIISSKIDDLINGYKDAIEYYQQTKRIRKELTKERNEKYEEYRDFQNKAYDITHKCVPEIKELLEDNFRQLFTIE